MSQLIASDVISIIMLNFFLKKVIGVLETG